MIKILDSRPTKTKHDNDNKILEVVTRKDSRDKEFS